uniref:Reverse transcriptase domain-containing protein n=1 Tax=Tanacetum cinerariifolium TaxID=118510 RepID=A0A6L2NQF7_TANCI|nr:hypothetical protein [Tanacetum cinerariifolium]
MDPKRTLTSPAPAMNHAAIQPLIDDHVSAALEAQAANMENTNNTNRNTKPRENLAQLYRDFKVKFATGTLTEDALSWWNSYSKPTRIEQADKITEILCSNMVPNTVKLMEVFIGGLPESIEGNVTASKPQTLEEAINITQRLMDQNRRQETIRTYVASLTENKRDWKNKGLRFPNITPSSN